MNIYDKLKQALFLLLGASLFFACSKDPVVDPDASEKRVFSAHITTVYKDTLAELPSGAYMMVRKKGEGNVIGDESALFVRYSTLDLKGNYKTSSLEEVAKNVGGYSRANYYGPVLFEMGTYSMIKGFEEAMLGQREGADVRILIPSWASGYDYEGSLATNSSPLVYDVEVVSVIDDYERYEIDTLERFSANYYNGLDSLVEGFYFSSLEDGDGDSVKVGDRISYNYVGRLLNGFVFDTNIEDTARKYSIYNRETTYEPVSYEVADIGSTNSSGESVVDGFAKALLNMRSGGKAITFFSSDWGYGAQRQDFGLRQQLFFYIEVVNEDN